MKTKFPAAKQRNDKSFEDRKRHFERKKNAVTMIIKFAKRATAARSPADFIAEVSGNLASAAVVFLIKSPPLNYV